jgi:hypothetical protein
VELDPVARRGAADDHEAVFGQVEENRIADHMAAVGAAHELLRLVRHEALHAVDREIRDELQRIGAFNEEVDHVMRLVEQHRGVTPCALLVAPVGEFRRNDRVHVGADLRVAQMLDGVASGLQHAFQITHDCLLTSVTRLTFLSRWGAGVYHGFCAVPAWAITATP